MAPFPALPQQLNAASSAADLERRVRLAARTPDEEPYSDPPTDDELRELCRGLMNALDEERRAASTAVVHLGAGTRLEVVGGGSLYQFPIASHLDASTGDPVLLRLEHREVEGTIARSDDGVVQLTLVDDIGAVVAEGAELLLDAPWMMSRLRDRIRESFDIGRTTPRLFNLTNALRTLGVGEIEVAAAGLVPAFENDRRRLNEAQTAAIEIAFRAPLSIIAAPAGTGKTLTIGALVEACYRAGLRTLVAAPSNVAVDLQMMQVCERLSGEAGFKAAEVLRVGDDVGPPMLAAFGADAVLNQVIARLRPNLHARLSRLQRTVDTLAAQLTAAQRVPDGDGAYVAKELRAELQMARAEVREVRKEAREYGRLLAQEARVVGATLARVFLDPHLRGFDVVVIDEASMAQLPAVFVAAGLARRSVVIVGDPYQLAAPVRSRGPNRAWLAEDVFTRLDVISAIRHGEPVAYLTLLAEQRRSADGICGLQRELWYGPTLRTAPEVFARERARANVIFGGSSLCYLDTSSLGARAYHPWGRTFANDLHAQLVADLVAYIDSAGELPAGGAAGGEVLCLAHYRGQVANIRRRLGRAYDDRGVSVRTVHRAQGAEATTAVFDLTLTPSQPVRSSDVLTALAPHHSGSRLLAVAASRARSRFVFIGAFDWIERSVSRQSVLWRLCSHLREHGHEIPVGEIRRKVTAPPLRVLR